MCRRQRSVLVALAALAAACSSGPPNLNEDARATALVQISSLGSEAGLTLVEGDAECSLDKLSQPDADLMAASQLPVDDSLDAVAMAIVDCVGVDVIAASVLAGQAPSASQDELDCAASRIDDELVVKLISSSLEQEQVSRPAVELAVATSLAFCLSPEHLLDQGG